MEDISYEAKAHIGNNMIRVWMRQWTERVKGKEYQGHFRGRINNM